MEPSNNVFDWNKIEEIIDRPGSRGKHLILRLHCDWHWEETTNCPSWLYSEIGVQRIKGVQARTPTEPAWLTDFNDPKYIAEVTQAIQAFAARYNNDPRIQAIQLGVLGYWGEWHTFGFSNGAGSDYSISSASANSVVSAYKTNFTNVPLQGRYPWKEPLKSTGGIGFHNDFFVTNSGHSDEFDNAISSGGAWLNGPVGGEVPPRDTAEQVASEQQALYATAKGESMIRTGHYSNMQMGAYRQVAGDPYFEGYMKLHRLMGYNYQIESANFADSIAKTSPLTVKVVGKNIGVAPTYHSWTVQFALLDGNNQTALVAPATVDLKTIKPQDSFDLSSSLNASRLSPGNYKLAVRIIQLGADLPKPARWKLDARNTYILFANDMTAIEGAWGADHALLGGWSVLGPVAVR